MKTAEKTIWDFVKELLYEHDCVIVPGLGGFVANPEPARIDQVSHIITPPRKHIVFNQNLKTNDGLLAGRIAENESMNYADAIRLIDDTVTKTKDILQEKKSLSVELFGIFRLNADANYVFLPEKQNNFLYTSFGLMPLQASPVSSRTIKAPRSKVFKDRREVREAKNSRGKRIALTLLLGTFIGLVTINLLVLMNSSNSPVSQTTMNISSWFDSLFHSQTAQQVIVQPNPDSVIKEESPVPPSPVATEEVTTAAADSATINNQIVSGNQTPKESQPDIIAFAQHLGAAKTIIAYPEQTELPQPEVLTITDNAKVTANLPQPAKTHLEKLSGNVEYYIIGGVFCVEKNATRFVKELEQKGFAPDMIPTSTHCNRVSYYKFPSRKEAEEQLNTIQSSVNPDAWLWVKHN